jgi:hypothetical protein
VAVDGTYHLTLARDRRDDFAAVPGEVVLLRDGKVIASKPVASVAWWRRHLG